LQKSWRAEPVVASCEAVHRATAEIGLRFDSACNTQIDFPTKTGTRICGTRVSRRIEGKPAVNFWMNNSAGASPNCASEWRNGNLIGFPSADPSLSP
jgi:hypothetical protein